MACSLISKHFNNPEPGYKTLDYWPRDMLNFDILEYGLRIVSPPHFVYNFSRKMFIMLYSIKWHNFIFSF